MFEGLTSRWTIPRGVSRREGVGYVGGDAQGGREGQGRAPMTLRHVLALEPLHRNERLSFVELAESDDPHDSGVVQARKNAALALKPRLFARVDARERDDFERNGPPSDLIVRAVNDPYAATAHLALDDEAARERLHEGRSHGRLALRDEEDFHAAGPRALRAG